jgi:hypothetical protein
MALEDFMEPEVGIAVAATAALTSPKVRRVLRQGLVYGLAGVLRAGDAVSAAARGAAQQASATAQSVSEEAQTQAAAPRRRATPRAGGATADE